MSRPHRTARKATRVLLPVARALSRTLCLALCALIIAAIPACGSPSQGTAEAAPATTPGPAGKVSATGAAYKQPDSVKVPESTYEGIDTSGVNEGWVSASATSAARLKFQIINGETTYNYDLPNDGTPTMYPINMGDGWYQFRVMQNTEGNNYVELDSTEADVMLDSEFAPFLIPNQMCNYTESSACVAKARELTAKATNEGEAVAYICTYVADNTKYDTPKAEELAKSSGYIPNADDTLATGKGICFDYASLSAAMLRSMGLPTKVMTGYVGDEKLYHAWIMVYVDGTWKTATFSVEPKTWSRCDVTFASTGATKYTGSGASYTDKYTY